MSTFHLVFSSVPRGEERYYKQLCLILRLPTYKKMVNVFSITTENRLLKDLFVRWRRIINLASVTILARGKLE